MAFYRSSDDDEVYCFTSDIFSELISSGVNPYNGEKLPINFMNTIRSQLNILAELDIYNDDTDVKDGYNEIFEKSVINNKKTEYAYNTTVTALENSGISKLRFETLSLLTQKDTILSQICNVNVDHFELLTPTHRRLTVGRVIYSLAKNKEIYDKPSELFDEIASALGNGSTIDDDMEDINFE